MPPVNEIELSSAHTGRKMVLIVVFLAIAAAMFVYGFMQLLRSDAGWQKIGAVTGQQPSCAEDITLQYELGAGQTSAREESRALSRLYGDACVAALRMFSNTSAWPEEHNVRYLNEHPNEAVTVQPGLYKALETVRASGDRTLYLGPLHEIYGNVFACEDDVLMAQFDPCQNQDVQQYFDRCLAFANDPAAVDVELLGDGQVRLAVSEDYMAFAEEEQIASFIDFDWMENAFIIDYLADTLTEAGYTRGVLSSYDGFVRDLGGSNETFAVSLYDGGQAGTAVAKVGYGGGMSGVYLRDYPMYEQDRYRFYVMEDGTILSSYLDTSDGRCRSAAADLLGCCWDMGCAETLLRMIPVYVADALSDQALDALAEQGVYCVWCQDGTVWYETNRLTVTDLYEAYTARPRGAD